ncbi:MAG: DUF4276 family protein [Chloroflexota bacterium]
MSVLVPIVEGYAELESVPVLLRRLSADRGRHCVTIGKPVRVGRCKVVKSGELERAIELAVRRPKGCDAIIVILDADDDCPKELAPGLLERAHHTNPHVPISVVLAKSEFEAWFLGSLESLRGTRGIVDTAESPATPEDIRGAKEFLGRQMETGRTYLEVDDQPALAARFDFTVARALCPSLDKFMRDVERILDAL